VPDRSNALSRGDRQFAGFTLAGSASRILQAQHAGRPGIYEYLCRRAGIAVVYCAEPFCNDGSPMQALLKHIKRIMAAEYSRELSVKVWHAQ